MKTIRLTEADKKFLSKHKDHRLLKVVSMMELNCKTMEIATAIGVGKQRVLQLYHHALKLVADHQAGESGNPLYGLSFRAQHCCQNRGLVNRSDVKQAVIDGSLRAGKTKNYGWTTHVEVCKWAGLPKPKKPTPRIVSPQLGRWLPIESAPNDGTEVLCFEAATGAIFVAAIKRCEQSDGGFLEPEPTHWMPLPSAPNGETAYWIFKRGFWSPEKRKKGGVR